MIRVNDLKAFLGFDPESWRKPDFSYYPLDDSFGSLVQPIEIPFRVPDAAAIDPRFVSKDGNLIVYPSIAFSHTFQRMVDIFSGDETGVVYPHVNESTPTVRLFEKMLVRAEEVAGLNDGEYEAHAFAAGMTAAEKLIQALCLREGNNSCAVIYSASVYGGVYNYLAKLAPRCGIKTYRVDEIERGAWEAAIQRAREEGNTRIVLWTEEITNPFCEFPDVCEMIDIARENDCVIVFDITVPTFALLRILPYVRSGETNVILFYSTSKGLHGFSTGLGGAFIAHRDMMAYLKESEWVDTCRPVMDWHCAVRMIVGMTSIHERLCNQSENALTLAKFLREEWGEYIAEINYPGLPSDRYYVSAMKYMSAGGGMLSWKLPDGLGETASRRFVASLERSRVEVCAPHIGHTRTLVIKCDETTHGRVTEGPVAVRLKNLWRGTMAPYANDIFVANDIPAFDLAFRDVFSKKYR